MDELLQNVDLLINYIQNNGANISPEMQQQLAGFLGDVMQFIGQETRSIEANIPTSAGLLWYIAGGNPEVFTQYLNQIPDPELQVLASNPAQLRSVIERLQENQPQERNRVQDGFQQLPIQSSNIFGYQYDPGSKKLWVKFQGDGVYEYDGVPPQAYQVFANGAVPAKTSGRNTYGEWWQGKNPSLGAAFFEMIKSKGYPYQRVA